VHQIAPCDGLPYVDCLDLFVEATPLEPVANAGADQQICENQVAHLTGEAENYSSVMWNGGDGIFSAQNSLITDYTPGPGDLLAGTAELCLTAELIVPNSVSDIDCLTLTIFPLPTVNAGVDATICESQIFETNPTVANYLQTNWTTTGDGYFDDEFAVITNYNLVPTDLTDGHVYLCLIAFGIAPCTETASDCMSLNFEVSPTAVAGDDLTICMAAPVQLNGGAANYSDLLWTTTGTGTFTDATILNPIYTPGMADINVGTVGLCLTATSAQACVLEVAEDCLVLSIVHQITITGLETERILNCGDYDLVNDVFLPLELFPVIENESSILWTTTGDGTFNDPTVENPVYNLGTDDIWNGGFTLCVEANQTLCAFSALWCIHVIVPIQIIPIEIPSWNGISSYVDKSLSTVPSVMAPVVNDLVIMINKYGRYYWPEPSPPINQLGNWLPIGYKAKFNTSTCLPDYGQIVSDNSFLINGANTFLPVLTNVLTNIETLLGDNAIKVLLIFDWSSGKIWTNSAADLHILTPGKAYLLVQKTPSLSYSVTYPTVDPKFKNKNFNRELKNNFIVENSPWNRVLNTAQPHIILFADGVLDELQAGDIVGAFTADGLCVGVSEFENKDSFNKLIVMGTEPFTNETNGYEAGENMQFKLFRPKTGDTYNIDFTYDPNYPNFDGMYEVNSVSSVVNVSMNITSINGASNSSNITIFPNPAKDVINVVSEVNINRIKLVNLTGQSMIDYTMKGTNIQVDVSKYVIGLYFLQIETTDGEVITKRIVIE